MRNFKKIAPRICAVLAFVILFESVARFAYEGWTTFSLASKRERSDLKGTIDTLYCGTSIAARGIQPVILDEALGTTGFNIATNTQPLKGTYYLIQETAEENPVKQIYLVLSVSTLKKEATDQEYLSAYEYLRTMRWKARYLLSVRSEGLTVSSLLYSTRISKYLNLKQVKKNVKKKLYRTVVQRYYGNRGWRARKTSYEGERAGKKNGFTAYWDGSKGIAQITEESLEYLYKIADFCREEGIELNLLLTPITQDYIDGAGDLDNLDEVCRALAEEMDANYYNFMLYKERQTVFTNDLFEDYKHMNVEGSEVFSELLAEVLQSSDPQEYFYDSMEEFK